MSEAANDVRTLEGRVALLTGASSGLGRATAIALTRAGEHHAGHANIQRTLDRYSHWMPSMGRNTANRIYEALD
jgi:NAD(P)-dependent dehydrogenase (short-subunit alcohol dehydrogenase family)